MFRLNVLRLELAAFVNEEELGGGDGDRHWDFDNYVRLLRHVDLLTTMQLGSKDPDFASIPRAVKMFWESEDEEDAVLGMDAATISSEHAVLGGRWVELTAARRVLAHLTEDGVALRSWAGQVFHGMYAAMVSIVRNMDVRGNSEEEEQQDEGNDEGVYEEFNEGNGLSIQINLVPASREEVAVAGSVRRGAEELEASEEDPGAIDFDQEEEIISAEDIRALREYQARNGLSNEDLAEQMARVSFLGQGGGEDEDDGDDEEEEFDEETGDLIVRNQHQLSTEQLAAEFDERRRRRDARVARGGGARDTQGRDGSGSEREMQEDDDDEDEPSRGWRHRRHDRNYSSVEDERDDGAALYAAAEEALHEDEDEDEDEKSRSGSENEIAAQSEAVAQVNGALWSDRADSRFPLTRHMFQSTQRRVQLPRNPEASTSTSPVEQPRRLLVRLPLPRHLRPPPTTDNNEEDDHDAMNIDSDNTLPAEDDPATASSEQTPSAPQWSTIAHASGSSNHQRVSTPRLPPMRPTVEPIHDFVPLNRGKRKRDVSEDGNRGSGRNTRRR